MKKKKVPYTEKLSVMLTSKELEKVKEQLANSTCRSMSAYLRTVITERPVTLYYRNKSFDDFIAECIALRNEMQVIREIASFSEADKRHLIILQEEIKEKLTQFAIRCLPE